jgi:hypothetical protein
MIAKFDRWILGFDPSKERNTAVVSFDALLFGHVEDLEESRRHKLYCSFTRRETDCAKSSRSANALTPYRVSHAT